jgi:hypothetical protein
MVQKWLGYADLDAPVKEAILKLKAELQIPPMTFVMVRPKKAVNSDATYWARH